MSGTKDLCSLGVTRILGGDGSAGDWDQSWPALVTKSGALHYRSRREGEKQDVASAGL